METSKVSLQSDMTNDGEFMVDSPTNTCTDLHLLSEISSDLLEWNSLDGDNEGKQHVGLHSEHLAGGDKVDTVDEYVDRVLGNLKSELENGVAQMSGRVETVSAESGVIGLSHVECIKHGGEGFNSNMSLGSKINDANSTGLIAENYRDDVSTSKTATGNRTASSTCVDIDQLSENLVAKSLQLAQEQLNNSQTNVSASDTGHTNMEQMPEITVMDSEREDNATEPSVNRDVIITEPNGSTIKERDNDNINGHRNTDQLPLIETENVSADADNKVIPLESDSNPDECQEFTPSVDNNTVSQDIGRAPVSTMYQDESPLSDLDTQKGAILDPPSQTANEDQEKPIIQSEYNNDLDEGMPIQESDRKRSDDLPGHIDDELHESQIATEAHSEIMPHSHDDDIKGQFDHKNSIVNNETGENHSNVDLGEGRETDHQNDNGAGLAHSNDIPNNKDADTGTAEYNSIVETGEGDTNIICSKDKKSKSDQCDEVDFHNPRLSVVNTEETSAIQEKAELRDAIKGDFDEVDFHNAREVHTIADIKHSLIVDGANLGYDELDATVPDSGNESPDVTFDPADNRTDVPLEDNDECTNEHSVPDQSGSISETAEHYVEFEPEQRVHSPVPNTIDDENSSSVQIVINPHSGGYDLKDEHEIIQNNESDDVGLSSSSIHSDGQRDSVNILASGKGSGYGRHVHIRSGPKSSASVSKGENNSASPSSKYGTNRSMFPLLTSQKPIYGGQDDRSGRNANAFTPKQVHTVQGHSAQNEWKPYRRQVRTRRDTKSNKTLYEQKHQASRRETNEQNMSEYADDDTFKSGYRYQNYKPNGSQGDAPQGQSRLLSRRTLSHTASPRLMPVTSSAHSTSDTSSVWRLPPRLHQRPLTTRTTASSKDGRDKQKEFFKVELKRLKDGLEKEKSKIKKPPVQSHIPYVFNTLEPYYNVDTAKYLIELPEEASHGYISRKTAIGLCDPWINLAMDKNEVEKHSPRSGMTSNQETPRKSKSNSERPPMEGSTRLPKFPVVALETDLSNKELNYNDVPMLRRELREKYSANADAKINSDYRRTTQDFYRMGLDKLEEVHPISRPHMRNSYFAYLQNTPGSRKAVHECMRKAETGIN